MKKGLLVEILRSVYSANGKGISNKVQKAILVGPGVPEIFSVTEDTPALYLQQRTFRGKTTLYVTPTNESGIGKYGFSGNFIYTSDARFPSDAPIKIHDTDVYASM